METEQQWHNVYITDKTGEKRFNTIASPSSTMSEIRNLQSHLREAKKRPQMYKFLDIESAMIMIDGEQYKESLTTDDFDLLGELFG